VKKNRLKKCYRSDITTRATRFIHFKIWQSQNCEKRLLASSYLSVRLSVRMEQRGPNWRYFY